MLTPGALLQNRYCILQQIGGGGMGTVYLAEDTRLPGRRCAVKEMSPANVPQRDLAWAIPAFQQEAQMLARISHPGLTAVTDFFSEGNNWYLVMEYVKGETLENRLQRSPGCRLPLQETLDIMRQLCDVLEYLHNQMPPVIFRDLKPGNVMLTPRGEVKLIDFGIARFFKPGQTRDTVKLGTPGYAAPEQYSGQGQSDSRSDIYSLGVLLHEMLTGHDPTTTPFNLPSVIALNPGLPRQVEQVVQQATHVHPHRRFQNIPQLRQVLFPSNVIPSSPISPGAQASPSVAAPSLGRNVWIAGALLGGLAVVAVAAMAFVAWFSYKETPTPTASRVSAPTPTEVSTVTPSPAVTPSPTPFVTPSPTATPVFALDRVFVPAGEFIRGSTPDDVQYVTNQLCPLYQLTDPWCKKKDFGSELPSTRETVGDFEIDRFEVTNAQYRQCVNASTCRPPRNSFNPRAKYYADSEHENYPVVYVTWSDANTYCAWVAGRLPTASEWEKAARGTDGRWWPWGNQTPEDHTNFRRPGQTPAKEEDNGIVGGDLASVGSFPKDASPYGVMDLAGNVMEWVDSWQPSNKREIRGGSWNTMMVTTRSANRAGGDPDTAYFDVGFRCAYSRP